MGIDLSPENQEAIMEEYGNLVCSNCQDKLRTNMKPIKESLDKGQPPRFSDMRKLVSSLCIKCQYSIARTKQRQQR